MPDVNGARVHRVSRGRVDVVRTVGTTAGSPITARAMPVRTARTHVASLYEDAFFHGGPVGPLRSLAEETVKVLADSTRMIRLRARRVRLSWIVAAVLAPCALVVLFNVSLMIGQAHALKGPPAPGFEPAPVLTGAAPLTTRTEGSAVPVFDVKSLPPAKPVHGAGAGKHRR
jgi:hypothetical protein